MKKAKEKLVSDYPAMNEKVKSNVFEALESLSEIIGEFSDKHVKQLYNIENINPAYFPRLSIRAAKVLLDIKRANPDLSLDFILQTVNRLASRGRPWESLDAFSRFAKYCKKEMTEEGISYLLNINSNNIEVVSYDVEKRVKNIKNEPFYGFTLFVSKIVGAGETQYDGDLRQLIDSNIKFFGNF